MVALVSVLLAATAHATQDAWPALFDVSSVAATDVLNIRAAPSPGASIVGALDPRATGIEVIRPNDRHGWGLVNAGDRAGWVSLSFLRRQPGQWLGAHPRIRRCVGTEPFWNMSLSEDDGISWQAPDTEMLRGRVTSRWASESRRDRHALSVSFDPAEGALPSSALLFVEAATCRDGMSDREYGLSVNVLLGNFAGARMVSGCCSLAE